MLKQEIVVPWAKRKERPLNANIFQTITRVIASVAIVKKITRGKHKHCGDFLTEYLLLPPD